MKKISFEANLPVIIFKEDKSFVAYTPALDLSTSAKTHKKVKERFDQAVNIFFEEVVKQGTLDEALTELGWRKYEKRWQPPVVVAHNSEKIKVPLSG